MLMNCRSLTHFAQVSRLNGCPTAGVTECNQRDWYFSQAYLGKIISR